MESFLNRYRGITILLLVLFAQLVLLAVQVKNGQDVRMIRVWTVTAVSPVARIIEGFRGGGAGFLRHYILLHDADAENRRLQAEVDKLKIDNIFLKNELDTANRGQALEVLQSHIPSKTLAATMFMTGAGSGSRVVYSDRGSLFGVKRGMAVVTADGIVGKVTEAYPTASEVQLVTDPDFAAGVVSQKNGVLGTLKGQGTPLCRVDYVPTDEKVDVGEWFYTSGDDRIFPRGFPAGVVKSVRNGSPYKEIYLDPSGLQHGLEDVLILIEGVHMEIPATPPTGQPMYIGPPVPAAPQPADATAAGQAPPARPSGPGTAADTLKSQYQAVGAAEGHTFGEGEVGSKPPDFTHMGLPPSAGAAKQPPGKAPGAKPPAGQEQAAKPPVDTREEPDR
ncbi:MAG TPA: rod shape-determining protein MreC [Bryobacteraceae bacterium]|nr:rod shape-determining protein MreC [Bryobacteraceae bacterium]